MKKTLLSLAVLGLTGVSALKAQSFSDDFESYNLAKLGPQSNKWTTWSGTEGNAEDPSVVNNDAHSGTKSVYFMSTVASGGPVDCVLPFGGPYTDGKFLFKAWFKVQTGKGAYFNFQGKAPMGSMYTIDCQMDETGKMTISNAGTPMLTTTYSPATWFELTLDINLSTNNWDVKIDGVSKGAFANPINQIYAIDIYPVNPSNSQSGYWVDDVSYTYTPYVQPAVNAALTNLVVENGLVGQSRYPAVTIKNLGTQAITSFDVKVDNNGSIQSQSITGVNIASYATYTVNFTSSITLVAGTNTIMATVSNVNGNSADDDGSDDSKTLTIIPVQPAAGKAVIVEEATGTWCQWCPRGAVFMKKMHDKYGENFIGIAVHNNDPMTNADYDAGIGTKISGYPSALVDRGTAMDPSAMETDFLKDIVTAPIAIMVTGAKYDANTRVLDVSLGTVFSQATTAAYRLACVITEDSVTGTTSAYNQSNAYAGGGSGPMGGYEALPNPVPASKMSYDHVARFISPSFEGSDTAFSPTINANDKFINYFSFTLDPSWRYNKIRIVGMLIGPNGAIENGSTATIDEAITYGYGVIGINDHTAKNNNVSVQPNPANNIAYVMVNTQTESSVETTLYQINGALISNINHGKLVGRNKLAVDVSQLNAGIYLLKTTINGVTSVTKLTVE